MTTNPSTAELRWPDPAVVAGLRAVVEAAPLVQCLTNIVVAGFSANVLLAIGASPAMVENAMESGPFAAVAGAVLINLGTLSAERERAMTAAAASAHAAGRPWVLDPVAVGALEHRTGFARRLLAERPTVIRGNASEVMALAGAGAGGKGVDSTAAASEALGAARHLAESCGAVVAVSGEVDLVTDGSSLIEVPGGHQLMTRVTGVGCALGALIAAFCAVDDRALHATAAASAVLAAAGSAAAQLATGAGPGPGPGTFAVRLLDELYFLAGSAGSAGA